MKALTILGAMIGLLIGLGMGLAARGGWPEAFWRGLAAAVAGGLLLRWWGGLWMQSWHQVLRAREESEQKPDAETRTV